MEREFGRFSKYLKIPNSCKYFCEAFLNNYSFEIDLEGEPDALSLASVRRHYYAMYYVILFSTRMDGPWILNHEY